MRKILKGLLALTELDSESICTNLYVIALVVVAALPEQAVVHDFVDIKLIKKWITVLSGSR